MKTKPSTHAVWTLLIVLMMCVSTFASATEIVKEKTCTAIQNAINKLPAEGGEVVLSAGTYVCTHPIVIDRNNISLRGMGPASLLRLANNINAPVIVMGTTENIPSRAVRHIRVKELMIDGNRANQTSECMGGPCSNEFPLRNNGISIRRCVDCTVQSVTVFGAMSGGLVTELGCRRLTIRDYTSYDNEFDGLAGYETEDSTFSGIHLYGNKAAGISTDIKFNNNKFYDVTIADNRTVGIFMRDSLDNSFTNLHIRDNVQHGIFLAQVNTDPTTAATGNTFTGVVISRSGGMGVLANDASCINNMLVGAQFINNKHGCISEATSGLVENIGAICR
ncbi:right-handed parallel beta-helix repeat-containing protein [Cellvibrio sp. pealriver]|uniref:right-handed parallel beta-helix repeat-containing protein n=1 Tax=Cellvibrio sp. pealriver TaxID=1622269 RepID=UPI00066FF797|nr:right-handed parallel beta-helix repeat-containing protein [Cellvibrio sp. pealriver]